MSEMTITHLSGLSGLGLVLASWLWSYAGRDGTKKAWRRFGSTAVIAATLSLILILRGLWSWWFLALYPIMILGPVMGYGGDSMGEKIIRRLLFAAVCIAPGLLMCFVLGGAAWGVLPIHVGVGLFTVYLGTRNPVEAAAEEFFISMLLYLGLIMYPWVKVIAPEI